MEEDPLSLDLLLSLPKFPAFVIAFLLLFSLDCIFRSQLLLNATILTNPVAHANLPFKTSFESQSQPIARTQLPLWLVCAVTIHKAQDLALLRIRLELGRK